MVSTRWSTACVSANACAIFSAGMWAGRSPWPPNARDRNWAGKNATSPSSSSISSRSTQLVTSQPPTEVVQFLNRFFAIVVEEVDRHYGLVNKFEGDASLAIFGAPNHLECPEDEALAAARTIADRLADEMPECQAGIGVAAGQVVAGNVGAKERFEYTVIGEPVNEAARLCELAKSYPGRLLATADTVQGASENECARWSLGETVTLRGHDQPTQLASPAAAVQPGR